MTRDDEGGTVARMAKKSAKKRNTRKRVTSRVRRPAVGGRGPEDDEACVFLRFGSC